MPSRRPNSCETAKIVSRSTVQGVGTVHGGRGNAGRGGERLGFKGLESGRSSIRDAGADREGGPVRRGRVDPDGGKFLGAARQAGAKTGRCLGGDASGGWKSGGRLAHGVTESKFWIPEVRFGIGDAQWHEAEANTG